MGKVLIACEESQEVCKAFRALGHEAYSCDLQPCSGGHPEWHLHGNVFNAMQLEWDMMIAHPPCTFISRAGARWMHKGGSICTERYEKAMKAKDFFLKLLNAPIKHIAIENPTPLKIVDMPEHSQVVQPYQFGHPFSKRTLLWLKNLPPLIYSEIHPFPKPYLPSNTGGKKRGQKYQYKSISQKDSSKTFPGIAKAMAEQWGPLIEKNRIAI